MHVYEVRPCKDHRGVDLISDALPFGRLGYGDSPRLRFLIFPSQSTDAAGFQQVLKHAFKRAGKEALDHHKLTRTGTLLDGNAWDGFIFKPMMISIVQFWRGSCLNFAPDRPQGLVARRLRLRHK